MKRDLDLCREILHQLEAHPEPIHADEPHLHERWQEEVAYHLDLLYEAGLVWSELREIESRSGHVHAELAKMIRHDSYRLTWAGHEFLDAARDNTRWNNAKRKVMDTTGGLAFEFLRAVLMQKGKELLGLE